MENLSVGRLDNQSLERSSNIASSLFQCCSTLQRVCFYRHSHKRLLKSEISYGRLDGGGAVRVEDGLFWR